VISGRSSADTRPGAAAHTSLEPTAQVTRQLTTLMTMVTLQSVTHVLETDLASTEFVVLPIFGRDGQPEYQIESTWAAQRGCRWPRWMTRSCMRGDCSAPGRPDQTPD
jgi:hypothetical protein